MSQDRSRSARHSGKYEAFAGPVPYESSELVAREATKKIRGYVPRPHRRYGSTESRELGTDHEPDPDLDRCAVGCHRREL